MSIDRFGPRQRLSLAGPGRGALPFARQAMPGRLNPLAMGQQQQARMMQAALAGGLAFAAQSRGRRSGRGFLQKKMGSLIDMIKKLIAMAMKKGGGKGGAGKTSGGKGGGGAGQTGGKGGCAGGGGGCQGPGGGGGGHGGHGPEGPGGGEGPDSDGNHRHNEGLDELDKEDKRSKNNGDNPPSDPTRRQEPSIDKQIENLQKALSDPKNNDPSKIAAIYDELARLEQQRGNQNPTDPVSGGVLRPPSQDPALPQGDLSSQAPNEGSPFIDFSGAADLFSGGGVPGGLGGIESAPAMDAGASAMPGCMGP